MKFIEKLCRRILLQIVSCIMPAVCAPTYLVAQTAGIIDISAPADAVGYKEMLRATLESELTALGVVNIPPDDYALIEESFPHILSVRAQIFPQLLRIHTVFASTNYAVGGRNTLFRDPLLVMHQGELTFGQRLNAEIPQIRNYFAARIRHLFAFHRQMAPGQKLFADCMLPPTGAGEEDWSRAAYITTTYSTRLQSKLPRLRILGIQSAMFGDWCRRRDSSFAAPQLDITVSGQMFRLPSGSVLLVSIISQNEFPKSYEIPMPTDWGETAQALEKVIVPAGSEN